MWFTKSVQSFRAVVMVTYHTATNYSHYYMPTLMEGQYAIGVHRKYCNIDCSVECVIRSM